MTSVRAIETQGTGAQAGALRLFLSRRFDRLVGVLHQTLGSADRARDVEAAVEIPQVLRGFERLLKRGLRETQGGAESLELTLIDLTRRHSPQMLTSTR
jgi:hypothetical protein